MESNLPLICIVATVLLAGCELSGISGRIEEKAAVFAGLTPEQKALIEAGEVDIGFTSDMVYMALGKPSETEVKNSPDGPVTMWTYHKYYAGSRAVSDNVSYAQGMNAIAPSANPIKPGLQPAQANRGFIPYSGPTMAPEPADLSFDTLYVFFFKGQVFSLKLASQPRASDGP